MMDANVTRLQRGDGQRIQPVFIAEGRVVERIIDGVDAALGKLHGDPLANAPHITFTGVQSSSTE